MAAREYSLTFELGPPASVQPGSPFTLPVIVAVRPIGTPSPNTHLVVNLSLRDETSTNAVSGLSGNLTASVRSRSESSTGGYAKFSPLMLLRPGKYRLRAMLSSASVNGVFTKELVESGVIHVDAAGSPAQRPTPNQLVTLERLTNENLDISPSDIAAWQRA
ncbi:hypothetical protein N7468_006890 [Penicillium chermesinum]|uniref:Velvet domain-containing protein n=1 Tax=Penicillium chermesinum TaxID=63820 RepID=A0A9W9TLN2_9EURO|nr:uncharacterized protein N7468_006890 [Penicillium chermesinum]KAJ5225665.1 hypothetical protein N7468_006890 [Penicillium chermesinum]KAJ6161116.1 hypothetical protein N7470_004512 [Penicillium chermesinum]